MLQSESIKPNGLERHDSLRRLAGRVEGDTPPVPSGRSQFADVVKEAQRAKRLRDSVGNREPRAVGMSSETRKQAGENWGDGEREGTMSQQELPGASSKGKMLWVKALQRLKK